MNNFKCNNCQDDNYVSVGCCSGYECGCMGQPIDVEPCNYCNKDEKKEPSDEFQKAYPYFFMTSKEWALYCKMEAALKKELEKDKERGYTLVSSDLEVDDFDGDKR